VAGSSEKHLNAQETLAVVREGLKEEIEKLDRANCDLSV
jgi:hypothetical protein